MKNKSRLSTTCFCSYLLLLSNLYFILVLFCLFHYRSGLDVLGTGYPFFTSQDRWNDFFNPLRYVWELDPYSQTWGNSPPFMFLVAYALSFPIRLGISWEFCYFATYSVAMLVLLFVQCKLVLRTCSPDEFHCRLLLIGQTALCFPVVYCFDRGNFVFVVAAVIAGAILAYHTKHYTVAAVLIGIAAALKLYPAILGIIFLSDKKFKQAVLCALTGVTFSVVPLFFYHGGDFRYNLSNFLEKSSSYSQVGNGVVPYLIDDKNSFYQLFLIPYFLKTGQVVESQEIPDLVATAKIAITILCALVGLGCLLLKNNHDRFLVLTAIMLGYPIESGVYNLILFLVPFIYWCACEKKNFVIPILGSILITCKSTVVVTTAPCFVSLQAVLNPICLLLILLYIYFLRSRDIQQTFGAFMTARKRGNEVRCEV